jgi:hypothetical protein
MSTLVDASEASRAVKTPARPSFVNNRKIGHYYTISVQNMLRIQQESRANGPEPLKAAASILPHAFPSKP